MAVKWTLSALRNLSQLKKLTLIKSSMQWQNYENQRHYRSKNISHSLW